MAAPRTVTRVTVTGMTCGHCVVDAARAGEQEGGEKVTEAVEAITRLVRS